MTVIKCEIPKKCPMRKKDGSCALNIICLPIVEQCRGCDRVENGYCTVYTTPKAKWTLSKICPMASHVKIESNKSGGKQRVGQQKQKKHK